MSVNADNGNYNGTVNNKSFSMNYNCTTYNASCTITCSAAQNVESGVKPYYRENGVGQWLSSWYSYNNEPGTVATISWNAGMGRTIKKTRVRGYVDNVYAYGTTINAS